MEEKPVKKKGTRPWDDGKRREVNKSETKLLEEEVAKKGEKIRSNVGRPSSYTPEIGQKICDIVSSTALSLQQICNKYQHEGVPSDDAVVWSWMRQFPEFHDRYREAKCFQMHIIAEQIVPIADHSEQDYYFDENGRRLDSEHIQRSKLRVDTRKWIAQKLAPKIYGDAPKIDEGTKLETMRTLRDQLDALIEQKKKDY